jgi:hypothetical protein
MGTASEDLTIHLRPGVLLRVPARYDVTSRVNRADALSITTIELSSHPG